MPHLEKVPTKFLVASVVAGTTAPMQLNPDEASVFFNYPTSFQVQLTIDTQTHSGELTREPFAYNAYDIEAGDWFAQPSGKTYLIESIIEVLDNNSIIVSILDENLYVLQSDPSQSGNNYPDEEQPGAVFSLDEDGNPILAGITNQSAQFPGLVYWIEDIKARFEYYSIDEEGITVYVDQDQVPLVTGFLEPTLSQEIYYPTGVTIEYTPFKDSKVDVLLNGIQVNLGDGVKTKDCYFSEAEGIGIHARLIKDITAGDELFWNPSVAGFDLDEGDDIDFNYEASNFDV